MVARVQYHVVSPLRKALMIKYLPPRTEHGFGMTLVAEVVNKKNVQKIVYIYCLQCNLTQSVITRWKWLAISLLLLLFCFIWRELKSNCWEEMCRREKL